VGSPAPEPEPNSPASGSSKGEASPLDFPVKFLKGVGDKVAGMLAQGAGIRTLFDLLLTLPRTYEDRRRLHSYAEIIAATQTQEPVLARAIIERYDHRSMGFRRRMITAQARVLAPQDEVAPTLGLGENSSKIIFNWFHDPGVMQRFPEGSTVLFRGKPQAFRHDVQIVHPELLSSDEALPWWEFGGFVPVYREVAGLSTRLLRKIVAGALSRPEFRDIPDAFPADICARANIPASFREAVLELHFPRHWAPDGPTPRPGGAYLRRVAFEELFMMAIALHLRRAEWKLEESRDPQRIPRIAPPAQLADWKQSLPYQLTGDQARALDEVLADLALASGPTAMHRLVQGDVGSGKTIVAFLAGLAAVDAGYQVALMAPTEILADQHYQNFGKLFPQRAFEARLLKGALGAKAKRENRQAIESGDARFIIGTQALLADGTNFQKLGLVIIDEQHRFGVEQRVGLKSQSGGLIPHLLVMTATPIPRSLALTCYGDLSMSLIREKPVGRTPIRTHLVKRKAGPALAERLRKFIDEGRQIYIVYPLVEESEELDLKDVQTAFTEWQQAFGATRVGLLHGRMKSAEKDAVMRAFKAGEIQALVSTTVIEVGVDVPNASVIVIEHAERFGLSQLHQLRGRVGRGAQASYCVLVGPDNPSPELGERLRIIESSEDGFYIAQRDLELRGPGEFLGRRQSGLLGFRVADLLRDSELMELARDEATRLLEHDPRLERPEHAKLRALLTRWWQGRMELALSG
jgi:ATP-dependent DNA helicase RecG